ncbi:hypothetical protein ASF30_11340 [Leifsonia sp. Leaf264]|nr:hypothetical protein ASF30_11340 [Leifsonia sp. Leaf264]
MRMSPEHLPQVAATPLPRRGSSYSDGWDAIRTYAAKNGHAHPPRGTSSGGLDLGSWVAQRRKEYRSGKLTADEIAEFEQLPFWSWDPRTEMFSEGIHALDAYIAREGHARVTSMHMEAGFALGRWVIDRRTEYRRGQLTEGRIKALEERQGWVWDAVADNRRAGQEALLAFYTREGHARVPAEHIEGFVNLGSFVRWRRREYQAGTMSEERIRRLESLHGWVWEAR